MRRRAGWFKPGVLGRIIRATQLYGGRAMYPETTENLWSRRAFLQGAGLGMLAASGLPAFHPHVPQAWAAGERTRFVSTWNAPDIMDPHVKYDVGAAAFNLNIYDNLLRYQ